MARITVIFIFSGLLVVIGIPLIILGADRATRQSQVFFQRTRQLSPAANPNSFPIKPGSSGVKSTSINYSLTGVVEEVISDSDGTHLILRASDTIHPPLPINASTLMFTIQNGQKQPATTKQLILNSPVTVLAGFDVYTNQWNVYEIVIIGTNTTSKKTR